MRPTLEEHRGFLAMTRVRLRKMQPGQMIEVVLPDGEPGRRIVYQAINASAVLIFGKGNYSLHTTLGRKAVEVTCTGILLRTTPDHRFRRGVFGPFRGSVS